MFRVNSWNFPSGELPFSEVINCNRWTTLPLLFKSFAFFWEQIFSDQLRMTASIKNKALSNNPVDTGRKLNVHKMFSLRPVSTGKILLKWRPLLGSSKVTKICNFAKKSTIYKIHIFDQINNVQFLFLILSKLVEAESIKLLVVYRTVK